MWNLLLNEDEAMIAKSVREYLSHEFPIERLRPKAAPYDVSQVSRGMYELGWFGVGLPEDVGGAGLGLIEEILVQRECGRSLVSPTQLSTVLAAHLALRVGHTELARKLASGVSQAALAIPTQPSGRDNLSTVQVFDWSTDHMILLWNEQGLGLLHPSHLRDHQTEDCVDESVRLSTGVIDLKKLTRCSGAENVALTQRAQVLLAAALIGLAEHACDLTVEYAKVRKQFGQSIGAFQAVKHRCADMGVRWRLAWYQTCLAALQVQAGATDAELNTASAKLLAAQAAHENGRAAIQLHGGIGFQLECDAHWFMKRAHVYDQIGGAMRAQARRVVAAPAEFRLVR